MSVPYQEQIFGKGVASVELPDKKEFQERVREAGEAMKKASDAPGSMVVKVAEWEGLQARWQQRLDNQRKVIDNLDDARLVSEQKRAALVERLETVIQDLNQFITDPNVANPAERQRTIALRDTLRDLVRSYR